MRWSSPKQTLNDKYVGKRKSAAASPCWCNEPLLPPWTFLFGPKLQGYVSINWEFGQREIAHLDKNSLGTSLHLIYSYDQILVDSGKGASKSCNTYIYQPTGKESEYKFLHMNINKPRLPWTNRTCIHKSIQVAHVETMARQLVHWPASKSTQ